MGLNGSGKSTALGLANMSSVGVPHHLSNTPLLIMSQMRAQNQQDLIYERGQAGITQDASVTSPLTVGRFQRPFHTLKKEGAQ